jgi:hypothetical protein
MNAGDRSGIRTDLLETVERQILSQDAASSRSAPLSPAPVERRLEGILVRDRAANWRIVFRFEGEDASTLN